MCDRSLILHVRCGGCAKLYQKSVPIPEGDDVPWDADELVESAFVREMKFQCPKCEATFAEVVAFKMLEGAAA